MPHFAGSLVTGFVTFVATNIDDIFILILYFAQLSPRFKVRHIVVGQYLGFAGTIVVSMAGFLGSFVIPQAWIGLLGLAPIAIAVKEIIQERIEKKDGRDDDPATGGGEAVGPKDGASIQPNEDGKRKLRRGLGVAGVAAVTFANGGDNIGIYAPLFATSTILDIVVIVLVFLALVPLLCFAAYKLTTHPPVAKLLEKYGNILVPLVLIALGVYIILDNGALSLIGIKLDI